MTPEQFERHMAVQAAILEEMKAVSRLLQKRDDIDCRVASRLMKLDRSLEGQTFPSSESL